MVARTRAVRGGCPTIRDRYGVDAVALPADLADAAGSRALSRALQGVLHARYITGRLQRRNHSARGAGGFPPDRHPVSHRSRCQLRRDYACGEMTRTHGVSWRRCGPRRANHLKLCRIFDASP